MSTLIFGLLEAGRQPYELLGLGSGGHRAIISAERLSGRNILRPNKSLTARHDPRPKRKSPTCIKHLTIRASHASFTTAGIIIITKTSPSDNLMLSPRRSWIGNPPKKKTKRNSHYLYLSLLTCSAALVFLAVLALALLLSFFGYPNALFKLLLSPSESHHGTKSFADFRLAKLTRAERTNVVGMAVIVLLYSPPYFPFPGWNGSSSSSSFIEMRMKGFMGWERSL